MAQVYVCDSCGERVNDKSTVVVSATTGKMVHNSAMAPLMKAMGLETPQELPEMKQGVFCGVKCAMTFLMLLETVETV